MKALIIRAGRLVDVVAGEIVADQEVLIRGERIEGVRPAVGEVPAGARVIDLSRHAVLPGLFDCHSHLVGEVDQGTYTNLLERSAAQEAMSGVRNARSTVLAGFTSVRDVGTFRAFVDVRRGELGR